MGLIACALVLLVTSTAWGAGAPAATAAPRALAMASGTSPVTISAAATSSSVTYGLSNTLSVSGLPGAASGTITFTSGTRTLCTAVRPGTGCTTPEDLAAGTYPVTASYSGDDVYAPASASTSFAVTRAPAPFSAGHSSSTPFGSRNTVSVFGFPAAATGSVTITASNGRLLCTMPDIDTVTSCSTPSDLPVGTYGFSIAYGGDSNYNSRVINSSYRVTPASAPAFSGTFRPSSPAYAEAFTFEFSGLASTATGSVTFALASGTLCSVTDVTSATSCSLPQGLPAGTYTVTATYSGDGNHARAVAGFTLSVATAPTQLAVATSASMVPSGTQTTFIVSGLPAAATGSVTVSAGGSPLCVIADVTSSSSCSAVPRLGFGSYVVTAAYSGDVNHAGSSSTTNLIVIRAAVTLTVDPAPDVDYRSTNTLRFSGLPSEATGSVTFTSSSTVLCTVPDVTTASSCTTPQDLAAGPYPVTALYSGDTRYEGAEDETSFRVRVLATTLVANPSAPSTPFGTTNTLGVSGLPATATGSVTFSTGTTTLCVINDVTLSSSCATPASLRSGTYPVTALYSGDTNHGGSTTTTTVRVTAAGVPTFVAGRAAATAPFGTPNTLTVSGLPTDATGSVTFSSGGTVICAITDVTNATGCSTSPSLEAGTYAVLAEYSGDANYEAATSNTAFSIRSAATALSATAADPTVAYGGSVRLSFGALPGTATGSVVFTSGVTVLCTVADVTVADSCVTPSTLTAGEYTVTASYSGDGNHLASNAQTAFTITALAVPTIPVPAPGAALGVLSQAGTDPSAPLLWGLASLLTGIAMIWRVSARRGPRASAIA